jgi:hypothetical protein
MREYTPTVLSQIIIIMKKTIRRVGLTVDERSAGDGRRIIQTVIDTAKELGVDPSEKSILVYDILDAEALEMLLSNRTGNTNGHLQISFLLWGIHFLVTPQEVVATRLN